MSGDPYRGNDGSCGVPHDTDPMFIREVAAHLTIHAASLGEKNIHNGKLPIYEVTVQVTFTDEAKNGVEPHFLPVPLALLSETKSTTEELRPFLVSRS